MNSASLLSALKIKTPNLILRIERLELNNFKKQGKLHKFTTLSLQFDRDRSKFANTHHWETAKADAMRCLSHNFNLRKVKRFIYYQSMIGSEFSYLSKCISRMTSLQHVNLNFEGVSLLSIRIVQNIFKPLGEQPRVKTATLNFCENYEVTDAIISDFSKNFKKLKNLEKINLALLGCKINGAGISNLLKNIKRNSLKFFNAQFGPYSLNSGLASISKSLAKMQKIEVLDLSILWCNKITDEGIKHFAENLANVSSLKSLSFQIVRGIISDKGILKLSQALSSLEKLQHFHISVRECSKVSNKGLSSLFKSVENSKSLKSCYLDFDKSNFDNQGLKELSSSLACFRQLINFSLSIGSCEVITDEGIADLVESLKGMSKLNRLSLNFRDCQQVTDKSIVSLKEAIPGLTNLSSFEVNLRWLSYNTLCITNRCSQLTNEVVAEMERAMTKIKESSTIYYPDDVVIIE